MALPELFSDGAQLPDHRRGQCFGVMMLQNLLQLPIDTLNQVLIGKRA